jgi:ribonuclease HI
MVAWVENGFSTVHGRVRVQVSSVAYVGINASATFLSNYYAETLSSIREGSAYQDCKGKKAICAPQILAEPNNSKTKPCNWRPPDPGWHSLCVDASFLPDKNTGAWGAIIRDDKGNTIVSAWDFIPFCDNAEAAESIACLEGTKLALSSVHSGLVVQSDCASLIKKLSSQERDRSSTASIVLDIKEVLQQLREHKVQKICRQDNILAHELAKCSYTSGTGGVMYGSSPPCVLERTVTGCNRILN